MLSTPRGLPGVPVVYRCAVQSPAYVYPSPPPPKKNLEGGWIQDLHSSRVVYHWQTTRHMPMILLETHTKLSHKNKLIRFDLSVSLKSETSVSLSLSETGSEWDWDWDFRSSGGSYIIICYQWLEWEITQSTKHPHDWLLSACVLFFMLFKKRQKQPIRRHKIGRAHVWTPVTL